MRIEEIEDEMKSWRKACAAAIKKRGKECRDYYLRAKIYDRDVKSGIFKIVDVPVKRGIDMLNSFYEEKINGKKKD